MSDRIASTQIARCMTTDAIHLDGERHMTKQSELLIYAHRKIDEEIRLEQRAPAPDPLRLYKLKKRKLALKDRMQRIAALYERQQVRA